MKPTNEPKEIFLQAKEGGSHMFRTITKKIVCFAVILGLLLIGSFTEPGENLLTTTVSASASYYTVAGTTNYLALRSQPGYDAGNEIGRLYNGESVEFINCGNGSYWFVYSAKLCMSGYVNKRYLVGSGCQYTSAPAVTGRTCRVAGTTNYLALRSAPTYDGSNEIGKLFNGDTVEVKSCSGTYWYVYSPKLCMSGYVNSRYLV